MISAWGEWSRMIFAGRIETNELHVNASFPVNWWSRYGLRCLSALFDHR